MSIIKRTALAEADLIETWLYIAEANQEAAGRLLDDFEEKFVILAQKPKLGRVRPDIVPLLRYFPVGNYLILYREITGGIEIVRVVHGARLLTNIAFED